MSELEDLREIVRVLGELPYCPWCGQRVHDMNCKLGKALTKMQQPPTRPAAPPDNFRREWGDVPAALKPIPGQDLEDPVLYWSATFFVIALIAALFGFTGIAAGAASVAKVLFFIFIVLFVVSLIAHALRRGP